MKESKNTISSFLIEIGKTVAKFRKDQGWTLEELGLRVGLDRTAIHRIEAGKKNLTMQSLLKLSLALEQHPSEFLKISFNPKQFDLSGLIKEDKALKKKKQKSNPIKKSKLPANKVASKKK